MIQAQKALMPGTWGGATSAGFFPAEMCFSERMIPVLASEGIQWTIVPDVHIARACADYPYAANQDNCDPPNPADQQNPAQGYFYPQSISRGVTTKVPVPYGLRPHRAQYTDPQSGAVTSLTVVPAADGMSWNEGYGLYGTGEIDAIASRNDPAKPMLVLFAHDGDNAWQGGYSYYHENVTQFSHAADRKGYEPTTVAEYLADHPVAEDDVVHVEDGGWVNADGDFGSPQFINWNWPLVNSSGQFDVANGWAEDERNWAVLTAAVNRVLTAEQYAGAPDIARVVDPRQPGTTRVEKAWHHLLAGHESGYMYYGAALDMEVKASLAANSAIRFADSVLAGGGTDLTPPTVWLPQRLPWNPGGKGGGSLWRYPGGAGASMSQDFWVWTFVSDVSGVDTVRFRYRLSADTTRRQPSAENRTYAGGSGVGPWQVMGMTRRAFPAGNYLNDPNINFFVMPLAIADEYYVQVTGLKNVLADYYVEAVDDLGNVKRTAIQHVWVGDSGTGGGGGGSGVTWEPTSPVAGGTLTIHYDNAARGVLPPGTNPVLTHIGHSGWTGILNPDPSMTWNATSSKWDYTYSIPSTATAVDFVFTNGSGAWDNNGGADWHVAVTGAQPPPWTIDGTLDPGLSPIASCNGRDLHAAYDGHWLYVAAPPVGSTAGLDHFILVAGPTATGTRAAPWAKSGVVAAYDLLLGNEDSNNWCGWSNAGGAVVTNGLQQAAGGVLEGLVDATQWWSPAPQSLRVVFAGYGTADGGALQVQVPCGNGDSNLDANERVTVATSVEVPLTPPAGARLGLRLLSPNPTRGEVRALVESPISGTVRVELLDVNGRLVERLHDGAASGAFQVVARSDRDHQGLPAGLYFLAARSAAGTVVRRIAVVR